MRLAYFVTPHGLGHAARSCAVMEACAALEPETTFEIFTTAPGTFFGESLSRPYGYHAVPVDIGLRQSSALSIDLDDTLRGLRAYLPFAPEWVEGLAAQIHALECEAVICDIAPLGIAVARAAGRPAILVENFTWDWIYEPYAPHNPGFRPIIDGMREIFEQADAHIQIEPLCVPRTDAARVSAPICRAPRSGRAPTRGRLGLQPGQSLILITLGGMTQDIDFLDRLPALTDYRFAVTGMNVSHSEGNLMMIDNRNSPYIPDLIAAADLVVAKLGYSLLAETWQTGCPLLFIPRPEFRESTRLQAFAEHELAAEPITESDFQDGSWLQHIDELLRMPRRIPSIPEGPGAVQVADTLFGFLTDLRR